MDLSWRRFNRRASASRGLVCDSAGDTTAADIGGLFTKVVSPTRVDTVGGPALRFATAQYLESTVPPVVLMPCTVMAIVSFDAVTDYVYQAIWGAYSTSSNLIELMAYGSRLGMWVKATGYGGTETLSSSLLVAGRQYVVVGRFTSGVDRSIWLNGVNVANSTIDQVTAAFTKNTWGAYREGSVADFLNGNIVLRRAWNRALSDQEIYSLSYNTSRPWSIYSQPFVGLAPPTPTLSTSTSAILPAGVSYMGSGLTRSIVPAGVGYMG